MKILSVPNSNTKKNCFNYEQFLPTGATDIEGGGSCLTGSVVVPVEGAVGGVNPLYSNTTGGDTKLCINPAVAKHSLLTSEDESVDDIPSSFPTSGWKQFVILYKRTFLSIIRDGVRWCEMGWGEVV